MQLAALEAQLRHYDEQVHRIDRQLVDLERTYLESTKASMVRGLDFYLSNRPMGGARARVQKAQLKHRIFSLSNAQNSALAESAHFNVRHHHFADDDDDDDRD